MDACLTQVPPSSAPELAAPATDPIPWIRILFGVTIVAGLLWRILRYACRFPIWGDEAMLLMNILDRDYAGLTEHLSYSQVAPLFFLWIEKTALVTLGTSEASLHLFPFLAGVGAFLMFGWLCRSSLPTLVAGLAAGIFAVSYYPVRHSCEVKPYAFDLFYAVVLAALTLRHLRAAGHNRWLAALIIVMPFAIFSSYTSAFVGGAVSLVLLPRMRHASWSERALYALFNIALAGSFLVHYGMVGHRQIDAAEAQQTREFLRHYWKDAFPPDDLLHWPLWLLQVMTGNILAYPIGAKHGGSTITFVLVLLGAFALGRGRQWSLLSLCILPFALNLVAAILHKYPFGDSARITLHLAPFICILMAHGTTFLLDHIRSPGWRTRLHVTCWLILLGCGVAGIARDLRQPYKTEHDRATRYFVHDLARQVRPDEPVLVCHQNDQHVLKELAWYLRTTPMSLYWLDDLAAIPQDSPTLWLVVFRNHPCAAGEAIAASRWRMQGWRIAATDTYLIEGENEKMLPVYCRKVRLERD